jgi:hypothetical protein
MWEPNAELSQKIWAFHTPSAILIMGSCTCSQNDFMICCNMTLPADASGDLVSHMITCAMAWCDGYTAPLLVPLNGWLQPPLPLQIKSKIAQLFLNSKVALFHLTFMHKFIKPVLISLRIPFFKPV